jgi:hypothetical protein
MKSIKLSILCLLISINSFSQLTYVPDDAFELYIETYISAADNGIANDNYVNTNGIQNTTSFLFQPQLVPSGIINDFTGIQDFNSLNSIEIRYMNMTNIDLSLLNIVSTSELFDLQLTIEYNNLVENLILPQGGGIRLSISDCISLNNIVFHSNNIIAGISLISSCPSLTSFDVSMVSFVKLSSVIWLSNNSSLQCVNLKNGYCSNWGGVGITNNPLVTCVEVDNPNYCNIASGTIWNWEGPALNPNNIYSTNCGCVAGIDEEILDEVSISPNPTTSKISIKSNAELIGSQFIIYDQLGKEVKSGIITSENTEIDLSNLTEGMYLFKVGAEMKESFKIIKQ